MKNTILKRHLSAMLLVMTMICLSFSTTVFAATAINTQMTDVTVAKYAGTGTTSDPYMVITTGNLSGTGAYTAPSKFWGDGLGGVGSFDVTFGQFSGDTTSGTLLSSYNFDLGNDTTSVWDGTWAYAFRFPAWTMTNTSTGGLRIAFPYKGSFGFYWSDWTYKLNVVELTKNLSGDNKIYAGDTINISYYGNYDFNQTNRGTDYATDFSVTDNYVSDSYTVTVDANGYATFSGSNAIQHGGNYSLSLVCRAP